MSQVSSSELRRLAELIIRRRYGGIFEQLARGVIRLLDGKTKSGSAPRKRAPP